MTTQEKNKDILLHLIAEANRGNTDTFWHAVVPFCTIHDNFGNEYSKEGYMEFMKEYDEAVPDYNMAIEDMIAEDNKVVVRYTETGTLKKPWFGMEATGKSYAIPGIEIYRMADGKITEIWMARDTLAVGLQVDTLPSLTKA